LFHGLEVRKLPSSYFQLLQRLNELASAEKEAAQGASGIHGNDDFVSVHPSSAGVCEYQSPPLFVFDSLRFASITHVRKRIYREYFYDHSYGDRPGQG
jgi:hypothetical protein